jgi:hypothetical protein
MYITQAARSGAKYTALTALIAALLQSMSWSFGGHSSSSGGFIILLVAWVPMLAAMGAMAGLAIFGIAGAIVQAARLERVVGASGYAILGCALSLFGLLPFTAWVAGSVVAALAGEKGSYIALIPGVIAAAVAGALVGRSLIDRGHGMSTQESSGHLDRVVARHIRDIKKTRE